jgi:hypothetical protein
MIIALLYMVHRLYENYDYVKCIEKSNEFLKRENDNLMVVLEICNKQINELESREK